MALELLRDVDIKVSTENGQQITSKRARSVLNESAYLLAFDGNRNIPGSTNQAIDLNGIATAKLLYIEADAEVNVRLNGAASDAFKVKPQATGVAGILLVETEFTELHIEAPTSTPVPVYVLVAGE